MKHGAVALFDTLGFRGIWKRADPSKVISKLQSLRAQTAGVVAAFQKQVGQRYAGKLQPTLHALLLSDTVVVFATATGTGDAASDDWAALLLASYAASAVMALGAKYEPAMAYRGCVAVGDFAVEDNFIIGPAVDEAASGESLAEAAIVWFGPSANLVIESAIKRSGPGAGNATPWVECDVPMKGLGVYSTRAVTPFFSTQIDEVDGTFIWSPDDAEALRDRILATFAAPGIDVAIKKQNTERFLKLALDAQKRRSTSPTQGGT